MYMDSGKVKKIGPSHDDYDEFEEQWLHETDEQSILGVDACREIDEDDNELPGWHVYVAVAEFIREEPLESLLHSSITDALRSVKGARSVEQEDREAWVVEGRAEGKDLVNACVVKLKELYPKLRSAFDEL